MSGLTRPQYAVLALATGLGIALLIYRNRNAEQVRLESPGLHRSNAIRRPLRRDRSRSSINSSSLRLVEFVRETLTSNRVVGQYQNDFLVPAHPEQTLLNLDLSLENLPRIFDQLTHNPVLDEEIWTEEAKHALRDHLHGHYVQAVLQQQTLSGWHIEDNDRQELVQAFASAGIDPTVTARVIALSNSGSALTAAWLYHPSSNAERSAQLDGVMEDGYDDSGELVAPAAHEYENSGGSPNMLNILYSISAEQARRDGYVHRGIVCNSCNTCPIQGIRYHCANCFDYDLCETCEASQVHIKTHVFYKIRIPAPQRGQIKQVLPKWYPGNPSVIPTNLAKHVAGRLKSETGMDITEIDAFFDQYRCLANARYPNDPCELGMAIDREAFDMYFVPNFSETKSPANLIHDRIFHFYDRDGDGLISFDEFVTGLGDLQNKSRMARLRRIFRGYDLDSDGYVCRKDFLRLLRAYYDFSRQLNREMLANSEELGYTDEDIQEVARGSQPLSAAFGGTAFYGHQSRSGLDKREDANGDLVIAAGTADVLQDDQKISGDRARAIGNAVIGHRTRSHPFRSFRQEPPEDEPLMYVANPNCTELVAIQHADDATEEDVNGPNPPHQTYGWPPLLAPEPEDIVDALGAQIPLEDITDPVDRSRVIFAQSQRLDAESDRFLNFRRQRALLDRYKRRQFYLDEEEGGFAKPEGYTEPDSSDEELDPVPAKTTSSPRRQSLRSRSSSKVRFDDSAIDTDYETRSNASSRSMPRNERWGGYELSRPELDIGQDILYQAIQQGFNELLDKLFKQKEDEAMEAQDSARGRREWKDLFEQFKSRQKGVEVVTEEASKDADMQQTDAPLNVSTNPTDSRNPVFDGPKAELMNISLGEPSYTSSNLDAQLQDVFSGEIQEQITKAVEELHQGAALAHLAKFTAPEEWSKDPTMPQHMPNEWDFFLPEARKKRTAHPTQADLERWIRHEEIEQESARRGGPGKLNFEEFRWKMRKEDDAGVSLDGSGQTEGEEYWEKSADLGRLSFVGTWLEMASF